MAEVAVMPMNWTLDQMSDVEAAEFRHGEESVERLKQDFWSEVARTIRDVFDDHQLDWRVDALRKKLEVAKPDTQTAFYHAEPLDVAADLVGQEITVEIKRRYVENILRLRAGDRPSDDDIGRMHPEDLM